MISIYRISTEIENKRKSGREERKGQRKGYREKYSHSPMRNRVRSANAHLISTLCKCKSNERHEGAIATASISRNVAVINSSRLPMDRNGRSYVRKPRRKARRQPAESNWATEWKRRCVYATATKYAALVASRERERKKEHARWEKWDRAEQRGESPIRSKGMDEDGEGRVSEWMRETEWAGGGGSVEHEGTRGQGVTREGIRPYAPVVSRYGRRDHPQCAPNTHTRTNSASLVGLSYSLSLSLSLSLSVLPPTMRTLRVTERDALSLSVSLRHPSPSILTPLFPLHERPICSCMFILHFTVHTYVYMLSWRA